jgi:hypothetical protein
MNETTIPIISYILVGVTSGVLALVTALDKEPKENDNGSSATSMLPSFTNSPSNEEKKEYVTQSEFEKNQDNETDQPPNEINPQQRYPVSGGKKCKKNKKTRSKKNGKKSTIKKSS